MGVRDEDLKRLVHYAKGLGLKVKFRKHIKGIGGAEYDWEHQEIWVYRSSSCSKTTLILNMLHELGHHEDFIAKGRKTTKRVEKAFAKLNDGNIYGYRLDLTKKDREIIWKEERDGIEYMDVIHEAANLKLPRWKVKRAQHLDLAEYNLLYKEGRFLTTKEYRELKQSITPWMRHMYDNSGN